MRILYLQQLLILPGCAGINRSYELSHEWVQAGHEVTIICSNAAFPENHSYYSDKNYPVHFEYEGIDIHVVDVSYSHLMPFWRRIIAFLLFFLKAWIIGKKLKGYDLLIAYSAPLSVGELGRRLARHLAIPWVFEIADVWPDVPIGMGIIKHPKLIRWLYNRTRKMYTQASMIFPFSEGMRRQIMTHQVPPEKIHVIHNGVNTLKHTYHPRSFTKRPITQVIYAGTLGLANGLEQIVEAADILQKQGRADIQFTMLGEGNQRMYVQNLLKEYALDNFTFKDQIPQEEVSKILREADIGLVSFAPYPILETNGATKFFDYLANGLPMIINYEGWQATYLKTYECGLYSKQGDVGAFAQNILTLADQPELRKTFSQNGRQLVEQLFDRKKLAQQKLTLLQACIPSPSS